MAVLYRDLRAPGAEMLERKLPQCLEQSIPFSVAVLFLSRYERLLDQTNQKVDDLVWCDPVTGADLLGRFEAPAADENRQALEQVLLGLGEQVVAPRDGCLERLLARRAGSTTRKPAEMVLKPVPAGSCLLPLCPSALHQLMEFAVTILQQRSMCI